MAVGEWLNFKGHPSLRVSLRSSRGWCFQSMMVLIFLSE